MIYLFPPSSLPHHLYFSFYHWISSTLLLFHIFLAVNFIIDRAIFQYILCLDSDNTRVPFVRKKKKNKYRGTENHHLILAFNFVKWVQKGKKVIWGRAEASKKRKVLKRELLNFQNIIRLSHAHNLLIQFRCKSFHEKFFFLPSKSVAIKTRLLPV